jgi:hypothetical protein
LLVAVVPVLLLFLEKLLVAASLWRPPLFPLRLAGIEAGPSAPATAIRLRLERRARGRNADRLENLTRLDLHTIETFLPALFLLMVS